MQAVLYVSHGTRLKAGQQEARSFIKSIQKNIQAPLQEICFLELNPPTIAEGVKKLVDSGATSISVVPVLLLSAKHFYEDIPTELHELQKQYPNVRFTYGQPLNVQDRLITILEERIKEQRETLNPDARILLVGRGSYEPNIKRDIETIASRLSVRMGKKQVHTCYLAACKPSFKEALLEAVESEKAQIIIIPYLWFNGLLIQSMQKSIDQLNGDKRDIVLCDQLGDHPIMKEAFIDRVNESFDRNFR